MSFSEHDIDAPLAFVEDAKIAIDAAKKTMGIKLRYNRKSLRRVDEIIEAMGKPKDLSRMVHNLGSYVGEVFRRVYKGWWVWNEEWETWSVVIPRKRKEDFHIFPFAKVMKRFEYGEGDSIAFYAHVLHGIIKGKIED